MASDKFNAYALMDAMHKRGWRLNSLQYPPSFHIAITLQHTKPGVAERFIEDCKQCTHILVTTRPADSESKTASLYGTSASVPDRRIVADFTKLFLDACYATSPPDFAGLKKDDHQTGVANGTTPSKVTQRPTKK